MRRSAGAWWVGAALLFAAAVRLRLLDVPLERDEGDYAYVAQLLLDGVAPYTEAYEMRLPGVFGAYALFLALFGESAAAIRLGLLLVHAATALLLYALGRRLADATVGAAAAVVFLTLGLVPAGNGVIANTEHFAQLPLVAGLCVLARPGGCRRAAAGGLLLGAAFVTKQTAAPLVAFGVLFAVLAARRGGASAARIGAVSAVAALVPALATVAALALAGSFERFWFWTATYPLHYAAAYPLAALLATAQQETLHVLGEGAPLWGLALAGSVAGLAVRRLRPAAAPLLLWLAFAAAAVAAGQRFRPQHFQLLAPPAALLAGLAASAAGALPRPEWLRRALPAALVALPVAAVVWEHREFLFRMDARAASRALHGANPFPEAVEIARYIREHSEPDDLVAVLGSEPQIYFYAQRRSATPYILTYELVQPHPWAERMQAEMIERLEAAQPRFVVFVNMGISWRPRPGVPNHVTEWYRARVPGRYAQVGQINIYSEQRTESVWGPRAARAPRAPQAFISVWELKAPRRPAAPGAASATPPPADRPPHAARAPASSAAAAAPPAQRGSPGSR
jgi:uncharacterized membrane protein YhaH (DUF805 family)